MRDEEASERDAPTPDTTALSFREGADAAKATEPFVHLLRAGVRCATEKRGQETPDGASRVELVVDASEGFIPLWEPGVILRWQFADGTLEQFKDPNAAGAAIEKLIGTALLSWGEAAPIKFTRNANAWDFEVVIKSTDDCSSAGCVLAKAFFPDGGRHQLFIYPMLFQQTQEEQLATLEHEIGHVFGLRHFFALVSETNSPAQVFGEQEKFTIMNYGADSRLTETDKSDLKKLYQLAWSKQLTAINGTPIKLVRPYHAVAATDGAFAVAAARA